MKKIVSERQFADLGMQFTDHIFGDLSGGFRLAALLKDTRGPFQRAFFD